MKRTKRSVFIHVHHMRTENSILNEGEIKWNFLKRQDQFQHAAVEVKNTHLKNDEIIITIIEKNNVGQTHGTWKLC